MCSCGGTFGRRLRWEPCACRGQEAAVDGLCAVSAAVGLLEDRVGYHELEVSCVVELCAAAEGLACSVDGACAVLEVVDVHEPELCVEARRNEAALIEACDAGGGLVRLGPLEVRAPPRHDVVWERRHVEERALGDGALEASDAVHSGHGLVVHALPLFDRRRQRVGEESPLVLGRVA